MSEVEAGPWSIAELGADRVLEPVGSLPQPADKLSSAGPVNVFEVEVAVDRLCLDATSFANIRRTAHGEPTAMAARIKEIVDVRGKMHNPETKSGGIALGVVSDVGARFRNPPRVGDRIATLASLSLTPLRLESVDHVDPASPQVAVTGVAYVAQTAPWAPVPDDIEVARVLEVLDVYGAASHTRRLSPPRGTVYVLGCGRAGKLAMAAARDRLEEGTVVAVDRDAEELTRLERLGLCDIGITADLRRPLAVVHELQRRGVPKADLTVSVASATKCESAAILVTRTGGTVLYFSMATTFSTAALTADGIGHDVSMLIGSGYAPDLGSYALDLLRCNGVLEAALAGRADRP